MPLDQTSPAGFPALVRIWSRPMGVNSGFRFGGIPSRQRHVHQRVFTIRPLSSFPGAAGNREMWCGRGGAPEHLGPSPSCGPESPVTDHHRVVSLGRRSENCWTVGAWRVEMRQGRVKFCAPFVPFRMAYLRCRARGSRRTAVSARFTFNLVLPRPADWSVPCVMFSPRCGPPPPRGSFSTVWPLNDRKIIW